MKKTIKNLQIKINILRESDLKGELNDDEIKELYKLEEILKQRKKEC